MKKLLTIVAVLGMTTSAMAADLTFKNAPPLVIDTETSPFFVGVNAGGLYNSDDYTLGLTAGANLTDYVSGEIAYDHIHGDNAANQVTGNLILGTNVGDLQPYVLGGVGYRWADVDEAVWNLGAGAKIALTEKIDFDARYRYVQGFETEHSDNVVTGGLVFKF